MNRGVVLGEVWATRKAAGLGGQRLKLVAMLAEPIGDQEQALRPTGRVVVAVDTLDARSGQEVLVAFGSGGRNVLRAGPQNRALLCDAAIALLVDREARSAAVEGREARSAAVEGREARSAAVEGREARSAAVVDLVHDHGRS